MSSKNQGTRIWHLCYHSTKYPVTTFHHIDDELNTSQVSDRITNSQDVPNANSTFIEQSMDSTTPRIVPSIFNKTSKNVTSQSIDFWNVFSHSESPSGECSHGVGHMSHIPRTPPSPATYTIPSIIDKTTATEYNPNDNLFGMIKLKDNDVCYTSGTIEWVGRKHSHPINSGFKRINEQFRQDNEPLQKRVKRLDKTFTCEVDKINECECANVLPTVNAIVDHLNALHEAVDLVDLRLNTLENIANNEV